MFKKPRPLAHLSFALVIIGLIIQSIAVYLLDASSYIGAGLVGFALVFYFLGFPASLVSLMRNWRVPKEQRLDLWTSIEVGVGILPFAITVILVVYALWFVG